MSGVGGKADIARAVPWPRGTPCAKSPLWSNPCAHPHNARTLFLFRAASAQADRVAPQHPVAASAGSGCHSLTTSLLDASVRRLPSDGWECPLSAPTDGFSKKEPHGTDRVLNPKNELLWWTYSHVVRPREAICGVRSVLPKTRGGSRHVGASGPSSSNGSGIRMGQHAHSSKGA